MKMFGVLDLETTFEGCRFSIGVPEHKRQINASCDDGGLPGLRLRQHGIPWRFHSRDNVAKLSTALTCDSFHPRTGRDDSHVSHQGFK